METNIGCHGRKKRKTSEVKRDYISDLPDPILVHILSFLPLKDAIKTVLFRRFGKMWLNMPVLDLDNCAYHKYENVETCDYEEFMDVIHQVWNHHSDASLDKVRLKFPFSLTFSDSGLTLDPDNENYEKWVKEKNAACQIEKSISYALNREVKALDLNFMGCDVLQLVEEYHQLPDVFSSNHLIELRLASCRIRSCEKLDLPALRVLYLDGVSLTDDVMAKVLIGCPFLEDLSVASCYGLGKLNCENPNLKKLKISLNDESMRLFVSCPHVVSLTLRGWIERVTLLDVSSLVDVSINFNHLLKCEEKTDIPITILLFKVRQCKNFSLCRWSILLLSMWKLTKKFCPFFKWKNITIRLDLTKWHLPGISLLLRHSLRVEALDIYIFRRYDHFFQRKEAEWIWEYDFDEENYWDSQVAAFLFLETITINGHVYEPHVIQLVKFLLRTAPKLRKMVISTKKTLEPYASEEHGRLSSEQLLELSQKLLTLPRASSRAMILFS